MLRGTGKLNSNVVNKAVLLCQPYVLVHHSQNPQVLGMPYLQAQDKFQQTAQSMAYLITISSVKLPP
jgi:hypothetical protein